MANTYAVPITVGRTIRETANVSVPIDENVLGEPDQSGNRRLNGAKVFALAIAWLLRTHQTGRWKASLKLKSTQSNHPERRHAF